MIVPEREWPQPGPRPGWAHAGWMLAPLAAPVVAPGREADRVAIEALLASFCWALDERLEGQLAASLAADAIWEGRVEETRQLRRCQGREAVVARYLASWRGSVGQARHLLSGTLFEALEPEWAATRSRLLVTAAGRAGVSVLTTGIQRTELALRRDGWKIDRLQIGYDSGWEGQGE